MNPNFNPKIGKKFRFSKTNQPKHNGRHKGKSPVTCLKELMNADIPFLNPITGCKEIDVASYACAIKWLVAWLQDGDVRAGKEINERLDGKVCESVKIEKDDDTIGAEIMFTGIPKNGAGKHRFSKFLT